MAVVLITGAASGIGEAAARAFAAQGDALVLGDADELNLRRVAESIAGDVLAVPADVRDEAATRALVQAAVERHGGLDVVCTIAGVFVGAARPHVRDGGALVLTSSISGLVAHPGGAAYAASKTAQLGLARSLAAELG